MGHGDQEGSGRTPKGDSYPWIVRTTAMINHWYFYCVDAEFGPFFLKFASYFPYTAKLCLNGHHRAQHQAARAGIGFTALDNGFAAIDDPAALQAICDRLGPAQIDALLRRWLARLPHPFTPADRRALRTKTTINNTYDFGIGRRLTNLPALREIGFSANRRLLGVQRLGHDPITGAQAFHAVTDPITTGEGTRIPGLRFADPRMQALLHALLIFRLRLAGFTNKDLRRVVGDLLGVSRVMTAGQMSYDLRRLRRHGLIERIPSTHRYQVTEVGLRYAMFLTRAHDRLLRTGLAQVASTQPTPLRAAANAYDKALDQLADQAGVAA